VCKEYSKGGQGFRSVWVWLSVQIGRSRVAFWGFSSLKVMHMWLGVSYVQELLGSVYA